MRERGSFRYLWGRNFDWVHEHFEGTVTTSGKEGSITLILRQTPDGLHARMNFEYPKVNAIERTGKWELGEGRRVIRFYDGREPSEFYLVRRGMRFAFQNNEGLLRMMTAPWFY